jgi:hypothetical protein
MLLLVLAALRKPVNLANSPSEKPRELDWIVNTNAADGFQKSQSFTSGNQIAQYEGALQSLAAKYAGSRGTTTAVRL